MLPTYDLLVLRYPYVERDEPMVFDEAGTYVETDAVFEHNLTQEWNHGLGEIGDSPAGLGYGDHRPGRA